MSAPKFKRNAPVTRAFIILMTAFTLFSIFQIVYFYGASIAGSVLKQIVSEQSDNSYQLNFEDLDISYTKKQLTLTKLSLSPTNSVADTSRHIYEVDVPELRLSITSIFDIYLNKDLSFEKISIKDPRISMLRPAGVQRISNVSLETGDLYNLINKYLIKFAIDSLDLDNGALQYKSLADNRELNLMIKNIDFYIENLLIDSDGTRNNHFLNTDKIKLILTDQRFNLADSLHYVSFDEFELSTYSKNILFKNLKLKQREDHKVHEVGGLNKYDLELPQLNFRGIDFQRAYQSNELILDSVRLLEPQLVIYKGNEVGSGMKGNELTYLLHQLFGNIQIGKLYIDNASTKLHNQENYNARIISSSKGSVMVENFKLDSINYDLHLIPLLFDNIRLVLLDQEIILPDSSHSVIAEKIEFSTDQSVLDLTGVKLTPIDNNSSKVLAAGNIPKIHVRGFDLNQMSIIEKLNLDSLVLVSPDLEIKLPTEVNERSTSPLHLKVLNLQNANLNLQASFGRINMNDVTTMISGFDLNKVEKDSIFNQMSIEGFSAKRLAVKTPQFSATTAKVKTTKNLKRVSIEQLQLDQNGDSELNAQSAFLTGFDLQNLLSHHFILFDSLNLIKPHLVIDQLAKSSSNSHITEKLKFNYLKIKDFRVDFLQNTRQQGSIYGINTTIRSFAFDSINSNYSLSSVLSVDSATYHLDSIQHHLEIKGLFVDDKSGQVSINSINLTPDSARVGEGNTFKIKGNDFHLSKVNFDELYNAGQIKFSTGYLKKGSFDISILTDTKKQSINQKRVSFDEFKFNHDLLKINTPKWGLMAKDVNASIRNYNGSPDQLLGAENFVFSSSMLGLKTHRMTDSLFIATTKGNLKKGKLMIRNVRWKHFEKFKTTIPSINISGLNVDQLLKNNAILLDTLQVIRPEFLLSNQLFTNNDSGVLSEISIKNFMLKDGLIAMRMPEAEHQDSIALNDFNILATSIQLDSMSDVKNISSWTNDLTLSGKNLSYILSDSLFKLSTKSYAFDLKSKKLTFNKTRLEPLYNRGEFQRRITYQRDWFDGILNSLEIEGIELDSLLMKKKLQCRKIVISQLDLDTHRDKRIPREPNIYKPLPQSILRAMQLQIDIDTVKIHDAYISHSEFSERGELPGSIFFRNVSGSITNITNIPDKINEHPITYFKSKGTLMNTGDFVLQVKFNQKAKDDHFNVTGRVGNMDLTELNRFLEHTAFVQIRGGISKSASFNFDSNEDYSMGEMRFYYDDLKISVLNEDTYETKGLGVSMKSFFANTFVVNSSNPHFIFVRDGDIFFERDTSKSIFNYWAKSILSGVVSSIGATNNKKEIRQKAEEIRKLLDESEIKKLVESKASDQSY